MEHRQDCQECQLNAEQSHEYHLLVITAEEKIPLPTVKTVARHAQLIVLKLNEKKERLGISFSSWLFIKLSLTRSRAPSSVSGRDAKAHERQLHLAFKLPQVHTWDILGFTSLILAHQSMGHQRISHLQLPKITGKALWKNMSFHRVCHW